jgi:hypothetical protein
LYIFVNNPFPDTQSQKIFGYKMASQK